MLFKSQKILFLGRDLLVFILVLVIDGVLCLFILFIQPEIIARLNLGEIVKLSRIKFLSCWVLIRAVLFHSSLEGLHVVNQNLLAHYVVVNVRFDVIKESVVLL